MKKLLICVLLLALLCGAAALGETGDRLKVVKCEEFVTLREEPSTSARALAKIPKGKLVDEIRDAENGFTLVSWRGQSGYVLERYLATAEDYEGSRVKLSSKQRYNINLFLSNFTEVGFMRDNCYDDSRADEVSLTQFAVEHCWFNRQNRLEWGEYFDYNNVRLPRDQIAPIVEKYFGVSITPSKNLPYIDYRNGWYYWEETGGHTSDGFACLSSVQQLSRTRYSVWFDVYAMGEQWDNDACYLTPGEASGAYPAYGFIPSGHAVIDTGSSGLDSRDDWRIVRYTVSYDY